VRCSCADHDHAVQQRPGEKGEGRLVPSRQPLA
jgi:hypothetical protein